ncbi:hypothetical protein B0O80DRAFT_126097 [Mortierella sp. GBAus27b]|nr:hypothetical protein BGX31_004160 [Mortierella sp. GBA43]KAI8350754.1 hypothetical protein B0O80DRAFT_126097 [Mortierella sp. GBAus27b]
MVVDLSRKRALQDLASLRQRRKQQQDQSASKSTTNSFPSLFQLAVQACVSHLQIFASLDGLPYHPFGQALYQEFTRRAAQWRLTTEQRHCGILLFAEAYGDGFLGPEYTGLRCSLAKDVPFLSSFGECLVYLDLSGGSTYTSSRGVGADLDANADTGSTGFTDKDMAGLSALSHLRILNLAHLRIGDTGLSHLIRSVTFGSSGPSKLEYLNLSGTDVTDAGLAKLFSKQQQQQQKPGRSRLVFRQLLGIDVTDSKVHDEVAGTLFRSADSSTAWRRLPNRTLLFADLTTKEQTTSTTTNLQCFIEENSYSSPMQQWVDRFCRPYKLTFGQCPDLAGSDGLGLAECLALSKLDQVYIYPLQEPLSKQQQEYQRRGEEFRIKKLARRTKNDESYVREVVELAKALRKKDTPQPSHPDLEHMFNLTMYQKVLNSVQLTFGVRHQTKSVKGTDGVCQARLAFVRSRTDIVEHKEQAFDTDDEDQLQFASTRRTTLGVKKSTGGETMAKIRSRQDRSAIPNVPKLSVEVRKHPAIHNHSHQKPTPISSHFTKKAKTSPSPFVKQEHNLIDHGHLPGRRRNHGGLNPFRPLDQPFVKPLSEQTHTSIYVTQSASVNPQHTEAITPRAPSPQKTPAVFSSSTIGGWFNQTRPTATAPMKLTPLAGKKRRASNMDMSSKTDIRNTRFHGTRGDAVSLDRWIRNSAVIPEDNTDRKVTRFDPSHEMFADRNDSSVEHDEHV